MSGAENGAHDAVFATIAEDGSGYAVVPTTDAIEHYSISGDGTRFAYDSWSTDAAMQGLIYVVDLAQRERHRLTKPDANFNILAPVFSPDDRWVMAQRFDSVGSRIVVFPADGKGQPVELGPEHMGFDEVSATWAPDASALLVTYVETGETWLYDVASASGAKVDWPDITDHTSWQRVAP